MKELKERMEYILNVIEKNNGDIRVFENDQEILKIPLVIIREGVVYCPFCNNFLGVSQLIPEDEEMEEGDHRYGVFIDPIFRNLQRFVGACPHCKEVFFFFDGLEDIEEEQENWGKELGEEIDLLALPEIQENSKEVIYKKYTREKKILLCIRCEQLLGTELFLEPGAFDNRIEGIEKENRRILFVCPFCGKDMYIQV